MPLRIQNMPDDTVRATQLCESQLAVIVEPSEYEGCIVFRMQSELLNFGSRFGDRHIPFHIRNNPVKVRIIPNGTHLIVGDNE